MKKLWVMFLPVLFFSSCEMALRVKNYFVSSLDNDVLQSISINSVDSHETVPAENKSVQSPTVILMKGNKLARGLPLFGENAIQAITGEYKLEMPDNSGINAEDGFPLLINTWLTSEFLYIDSDVWEVRVPLQNLRAREIRNENGLFIVSSFSGTIIDQAKWSILFHIPQATINAGMNDAMINRMIQNWTSRLSYYISMSSQNGSQISLPAVVEF